jgi:hypothetical protein
MWLGSGCSLARSSIVPSNNARSGRCIPDLGTSLSGRIRASGPEDRLYVFESCYCLNLALRYEFNMLDRRTGVEESLAGTLAGG